MMRPTGSASSDSASGQVWITSNNTGPTSPIVCQRSPSGVGSGLDAWSGSSNTSTAVSNDKPCLARFATALSGSHVQRTATSFVTTNMELQCQVAADAADQPIEPLY